MANRLDKNWKTLRVVVELPARGEVSEYDLRWALERAFSEHQLHDNLNQYRGDGEPRIQTGRMKIKEFQRVVRGQNYASL